MSEPEELNAGSMHADKIGKVVVVDIEGRAIRGVRGGILSTVEGRILAAGVLHDIGDDFEDDSLVRTTLTVGTAFLVLDWDNAENLSARIEVQPEASA